MKFDHIKKNLSIFKGVFSPAIDEDVNSEWSMVDVPELNENHRFIFSQEEILNADNIIKIKLFCSEKEEKRKNSKKRKSFRGESLN
jgi:hypothetical protein